MEITFKIDDEQLAKKIQEKCDANNITPSDESLALLKQWALLK